MRCNIHEKYGKIQLNKLTNRLVAEQRLSQLAVLLGFRVSKQLLIHAG